jgi:phosphoserine aminotransferase
MSQVSFYPGPSKVYSNTTEYIYEAYASGILSINHRSEEFMDLMGKLKKTLRKKLAVPADYEIAFVSSATECWEIISQSLVKDRIAVGYNGAFGKKWAAYASALSSECVEVPFDVEQELPVQQLAQSQADVVGIVHNETSNGTFISDDVLSSLNTSLGKNTLLTVDATSSMAGIALPFELADIWFASVQKCFGLPAGMALMIISPKAIERAYQLDRRMPYNALIRIVENTKKNQTHYTPNVLNIYLLYRTQRMSKGIDVQHEKTLKRFRNWSQLVEQLPNINWLVKNESVRSPTVLALVSKNVEELKRTAKSKGIILGSGYGDWKESTIRIANFPAIKGKEIERLAKFLRRYYP